MLLLTNDDGIDAPGLQALHAAVGGRGAIVAPAEHQSGCSHQVTTGRSLRVEQRDRDRYAVSGLPADCVRVGLTHLYPDTSMVLSGINAGGNLGSDIFLSGTVAAVREAALLGIPGIAISHYRQGDREFDWDWAMRMAVRVLEELTKRSLPPRSFWNVNFPHPHSPDEVPEFDFCEPCTQPLPVSYRIEGDEFHYTGRYSERRRDAGADVDACFSGRIAISQVTF
ncbi:MAG: 5'/3'-nucleotidase SurE [Cyanobacteria bacterium J06639_1]